MSDIARTLAEWHEDFGPVLWWVFPIAEPPYCGTPLDCPRSIQVEVRAGSDSHQWSVEIGGGWPGYHTHWTPLPEPPTQPIPSIDVAEFVAATQEPSP